MLYSNKEVIAPKTLKLIQQLQSLPELNSFYLVGGTALALQLGHRNSIDIDLFSMAEFDDAALIEVVERRFAFEAIYRRPNTIIGLVDKIKVDFIKHDYPFINPPKREDDIAFLSLEDIAAMKLHAIIQSGKRMKDFIDIYFLLEHFSSNEMLQFFSRKYTYTNPLIALKALNFFDDIDEEIDPPKLLKPLSLKKIKKRIEESTLHGNKKFK